MKWGVRRYQNEDGSLTVKGKARFRQVQNNDRLSRKNTKQAIKVLKKNRQMFDALANSSETKAAKAYSKADKHVLKSEAAQAKHDRGKFEKHQSKAWKELAKQAELIENAEVFLKQSDILSQKIDRITRGELKAGKDFIVQNDYDFYPIVFPVPGGLIVGGSVSREQTIIERK